MKASEVIAKLQEMRRVHGDLKVFVDGVESYDEVSNEEVYEEGYEIEYILCIDNKFIVS